jgi:putative tricarboxylic transport membrane protein
MWLLIGVLLGIVTGALPGLTATMAVTLLLPFTLGAEMSARESMAMLIGIYVGAIYGGSIAAVLICTPGTPAAAATVLDGFPMTQRGEAGRALGLTTLSSFCGGFISAIVLILFSPLISRFALEFGPPQYFALAVFGLSMIVSISGRSVLKGAVSGAFGVLLACVGLDPIEGVPRMTFGRLELAAGIGFIPALIGLFAFAQVFAEIVEGGPIDTSRPPIGRLLVTVRELARHKLAVIRSALIGVFTGSLPGAGADIAAFISYNEARRVSKHRDQFGQGAPEGVIAAEAANNAATGGAMIPMLTLGVPGDAVTAVMLGALTVHGLQPGPMLFRDHMDEVYPIFASTLMANVFMLIAGLLSVRYVARIISMDKKTLIPIIAVLSVVGAYAMRYSLFDVAVAIGMGVVGYGMKRYRYPASPIVLALILGPMAEQNLRRTLKLPDVGVGTFLSPICAVLLGLALVAVVMGVWRSRRGAGVEGAPPIDDTAA